MSGGILTDHKPERLTGRIGDGVSNRRGHIRKIVCGQGMRFVTVAQNSTPVAHEIELFLARILDGLAGAVRIDHQFSEADYALRQPRLDVSLSKDRSVMARLAGEVSFVTVEDGHIPIQPGRLDSSLLSKQSRRDRQKHHDESSHFRDLH